MIGPHRFNSEWWGGPTGIVTAPEFFALEAEDARRRLHEYRWVEFKSAPFAVEPARLVALGFALADIQVNFRIGLQRLAPAGSLEALEVATAASEPFRIGARDFEPFAHERFDSLPESTPERVSERVALWARSLIEQHPRRCLQVSAGGVVQGWFLAADSGARVNLTLAMLARGARITGMHLYQRALLAYAQSGASIGFASFSARNTAVMNIYAKLGATFVSATDCWLWWPRPSEP